MFHLKINKKQREMFYISSVNNLEGKDRKLVRGTFSLFQL